MAQEEKLKLTVYDNGSQDAVLILDYLRKEKFEELFDIDVASSDKLGISIDGCDIYDKWDELCLILIILNEFALKSP